MTYQTLKRIVWRLREQSPDTRVYLLPDIEKAIMLEAGIDDRTIKTYVDRLARLDYIKRIDRWHFQDLGVII